MTDLNAIHRNLCENVCPVCGKIFCPAPYHVYRVVVNKRYHLVCSYSCMMKADRKKREDHAAKIERNKLKRQNQNKST